jgi:hypothetical protein
MALVDALETATDEEIVEAGDKMAGRLIKRIILGVVTTIVVHFASEFAINAIEKKTKPEITD